MFAKLFLRLFCFFFVFGLSHAAHAAATLPDAVKKQIVKLNTDSGDSCMIVSFFPAYYGPIQGVNGNVAVGAIDQDNENCAGMAGPPAVSIVAYVIYGGNYHKVAMPASVVNLQQPQILSVVPRENGFTLYTLFHGPSDPMCCAKQKATDWIPVL